MAGAYASWALPQVIGLSNTPVLPDGALEQFIVMSLLCLAAVWWGESNATSHPVTAIFTVSHYGYNQLVLVALALNAFGVGAAHIGIALLSQDYLDSLDSLGGAWSGPITIVLFLAAVQKYGFALSLIVYQLGRSRVALGLLLFGLYGNVLTIFGNARRGPAMDCVLMILLSLWFTRRRAVHPALMIALFVGGSFFSAVVGDLRSQLKASDASSHGQLKASGTRSYLEIWTSVDPVAAVTRQFEEGGEEIKNGAMAIWAADSLGHYDYGLYHWNRLVHGYFPGQIFGHKLKKSLMFEAGLDAEKVAGYRSINGTTRTGMADCFQSFWYLGFLKYALIGWVMGRWFARAMKGDLVSQVAYSCMMASALHTVSHGTDWLLNQWIHMAIFVYPLLYWARKPAVEVMIDQGPKGYRPLNAVGGQSTSCSSPVR